MPSCPKYVLYRDGTFDLFRLTFEGPATLEAYGVINPELVTAINEVVSLTDLAALRDRLPPEQCWGCVDGIDTAMVFGDSALDALFSSVMVELDVTEPLFAAAFAALEEMSNQQTFGVSF